MIDPASILFKAIEAIISFLIDKASEKLFAKLKGDPAKKAFKKALGAAILRYSKGKRLALARPFHEKRGLLTNPIVAEELSHIIRFDREPNVELIGKQWEAAYPNPPVGCNFTDEAKVLLEYFKNELKCSEVFRPVFNSKSLDAIDVSVASSVKSLDSIESQLFERFDLMISLFGDLTQKFIEASPNIGSQIRDYTRLIEEKTKGFVGRNFVFEEIRQFVEANHSGYFFIRGDPGIGKTALSAQMVKLNGYVHHFNVRAEGINRSEAFLKNVSAQLIANYKLKHSTMPPEAAEDAGVLNDLLSDVSNKLASGEKAIIILDALDEVDYQSLSPGVNPLFLPTSLPNGIYMVVTLRNEPISLRIDCEQQTYFLKQDLDENIADIREYVASMSQSQGIKDYIKAQSIEEELFIRHLVEKSQGNFIYLRYVLPEIKRGAYKDLALEVIPAGLENYYEDHWRRMRGMDEDAWFEYKLPIVMALTVVKKPVSIDLISLYSGGIQRSRIRDVLRQWSAFLFKEFVEYEGGIQKRYRIYHDSFRDFIAQKEEVASEKVDLKAAEAKIADIEFEALYQEQ